MFEKYAKGEIAQLMVQLRAVQLGFVTSKPTVEARYDLIIDTGTLLERAQVKYADCWTREETLSLDLRKETRNNGKKRLYQSHEVDALYVYVPRHHVVLRFGGDLFHNKPSLSLRTSDLQNGLMRGCLILWNHLW